MITELGHFALILAFCTAIVQAILPMIGAQKGWSGWMAAGSTAAGAQFLLIAFAFAALMHAFVTDDFSLLVVYDNSQITKPMIYKIAGVWGNHEGSMLLWVLILALYGACAAWFGKGLPPRLKARVLSVQGAIGAAFLIFILLTSNPFLRIAQPPFNGRGMNPLLEDPGLAFHPPFLYLGYVGLSMAFSFAIAALIEGRVDATWARWVRPWTLVAWMFLTVGIAMGSWWAYYELGWGGFWFWDPVENASFMPWLIASALLHSAIVVEKREALKSWTILLAILGFAFSLIGTFIVRSGVITSVHSFASDPSRGVFILAILAVFVGGGLTLYAARAQSMQSRAVFSLVSRESALVFNNILLAVGALVVFVGTLWPLFAQMAFGRVLSVGAPFFNQAFTPFMLVLAALLPVGALMPWKRAVPARLVRPLIPVAGVTVIVALAAWVLSTGRPVLAPIAAGLASWLIAGAAAEMWQRAGHRFVRLFRLPRADWGKALAHAGFGVVMAGIGLLTANQSEAIRTLQIGQSLDIAGYSVTLDRVDPGQGPNYSATIGTMTVRRGSDVVAVMHPEKRSFPVQGMTTTEAAIRNGFLRDIYLVLGDRQQDGGWAVRAYIKPFASWLWMGALIMGLGGFLSLSDRRYRVAAGARAARKAAPNAHPAE